jgi:quercetin dioxygenase-like cupin family protein
MNQASEIVKIGQLELKFLLGAEDSNNKVTMFEFTIPPGARVPAPHYHLAVDEILYGLEGVTTSVVNGQTIETTKGERLFIKRGDTHQHTNYQDQPAKTLCILTPADIGIEYFRELSNLIVPGKPPDALKVNQLMAKFGLIVSES